MSLDPEIVSEVAEGPAYLARAPKLMEVLNAVSAVYQVGKMDMMSMRRYAHLVEARDAFYWCARSFTPRTYVEIGRFFGDRDHSTVLTGIARAVARFDKHKSRIARVAERLGVEIKEMQQ